MQPEDILLRWFLFNSSISDESIMLFTHRLIVLSAGIIVSAVFIWIDINFFRRYNEKKKEIIQKST